MRQPFRIEAPLTRRERAFHALLLVLGCIAAAGTVFGIVMLALLGMAR